MHRTITLLSSLLICAAAAVGQVTRDEVVKGLKWRLVGPFRGGRSVAASGVVGRPDEFYFGATGGGVWKTTNAGVDWTCVSDGFFKTASVGAIAVSRSNPDVVYVGMGECDIRGNISHGDGVYKSADAGRTWTNVGLRDTRYISKVRIHPNNPDVVYVAALGHVYGPHPDRGVFRTTDGGRTWTKILYVGDRAGAIDIEFDPSNPETLYAATWEAWRTPYSLNSGGPGSRLWKSTDGGATWKDLSKNPGLPKGLLGKIGISPSPANPKRVYAIIEALDGGIFRSDDAGATWTLVNEDRNWRQRAWYYTHVYADPKDENTVYVLNVGAGKSTDGGKTFRSIRTPHSDNHDLWIDPNDPLRMINANDGGANVSTNGGSTWTEQDIPTAQFYHVSTDNAFPYRILGAQQDNSTVRIASRTSGRGITADDWTSTAGGESGYVAAKPDDPEIVFGGSYGGYLERFNHRTGMSRDVNVWPDNPMGHGAGDSKHRQQWTFPIVFSPHDPGVLYTCTQHVLRSTNQGHSWEVISPDLTRNEMAKLGPSGGPITKDNTGVEYYCTVFTFAESPVRKGLLWAGSDDGLVHVSLDSGKTWSNVTPRGMPEWGLCSMIEPSPHEAGAAYLAVDNHENDDHAPYIFKTADFGRTWTKTVTGIGSDASVRVVREDPVRRGLLFAGTETGVYVSFDDGAHWQSLQNNLPLSPVHDLVVKDADVVVATHGRSFWVLDDISPLRQIQSAVSTSAILFRPESAYRARFGGNGGPTTGDNPLSGIVVNYALPSQTDSVKVEVIDSDGFVVAKNESAPGAAGLNRISLWPQYPSFTMVQGMIFWAAGPRPITAPPGTYTVRLTVGSNALNQSFSFVKDPRAECTEADLIEQARFARQISARVDDANRAVTKIRSVRDKVNAAVAEAKKVRQGTEAEKLGLDLVAKMGAVEEEIYQVRNKSGQDPLNYPIKLNNKIAALLGVVLSGDFPPTKQSYEVFDMLSTQLETQLKQLNTLLTVDLAKLNAALKSLGIAQIVVD